MTTQSDREGNAMGARDTYSGSEVERIERTDRLAAQMLKQGDSRSAVEVWDAAYGIVCDSMSREAAADAECARDEWNAS